MYAVIYTLGCRVNTCESLSLADRLTEKGVTVLSANSKIAADIVIVNTCAVTAESARKCRQAVRRARQKYPDALIIATGCFAQSGAYVEDADIVSGTACKDCLADYAVKYAKNRPTNQLVLTKNISDYRHFDSAEYKTPYKSRCHIKIEDGCDSKCSYCIIPSLRGPVRSKDPQKLLSQIEARLADGVKEILLTGIETGSYGKDLKNTSLIDILEKTDRLDGLYLIRIGSLDPFCFTDEFINRLSKLKHLERHIHLSVQSGSSAVLASMKRKYNGEFLLERIAKIYEIMPDVMLTADVITGFPGETDEDFRKTAELARFANFLHMHIFPYSEREGTVAATMDNQVPVPIRKQRAAELERINKECKKKRLQSAVGTVQTVHFETKKGNLNTGYTKSYMPVRVDCEADLKDTVADVYIEGIENMTLFARLCEEKGIDK